MRYKMGSTWYQMLLIFMFLRHTQSDELQRREPLNVTLPEDSSESQNNTNQDRSSKITTISEQEMSSAGISPLLQYHENFQIKNDDNQNIHSLTKKIGIANFNVNSSREGIQNRNNFYASLSPGDVSKLKEIQNNAIASPVSPSYSAPASIHSAPEDYSNIQQQFAHKPSNTSSYTQVPTFDQNIAYNDYVNQLSLYHILNNLQQQKQTTTTPIPAFINPIIQTESKPSPPPIDKNHYSNIAYIPAVHGAQLQSILSASPPAPPPGPELIAVTGFPNLLPPGIPDTSVLIENSVQNTPGLTSTSLANCLKGKLCAFLLASLIAAGTTGALALPIAWPFLGSFLGRKKRDTTLENPTLNLLNENSEIFNHNDNNIPAWIIDWYKQTIHSDIVDNESLTKFLGLRWDNNNEYLVDKKQHTSVNTITDHSNKGPVNVPATPLMPPKTSYKNRPLSTSDTNKNMKTEYETSDDNKTNIPPFNIVDLFSRTCNVIDNNEIPQNEITNYIANQCSIMVQH